MSTVTVSLRGPRGKSASEQLYLSDEIPEPTTPALVEWIKGQAGEQASEAVTELTTTVATDVANDVGTAAGRIEAERVSAGVESRVLSYTDQIRTIIENLIGGDGKVPTYTDPAMGIVLTGQPQIILPQDDYRIGAVVQSERVDIAIGQGDSRPDFDGQYHIIYAGAGVDSSILQRKPIYAVARWPLGSVEAQMDPAEAISVGCAVTVERLTTSAAPEITLGDRIVGYWPDPVHADFRNAVRNMINALADAGVYAKMKAIFVPNVSLANYAINLANPSGPQALVVGSGAVTNTPYHAVQSDGAAVLDPQLLPAALGMTGDSHMLFVWPGSTQPVADTGRYIIGGSTLALQPNRSATLAAWQSGSAINSGAAMAGSRIALSRRSMDAFDRYANGQLLDTVTRTFTALPSRHMTLLGRLGGAGPQDVTLVPMRAAAMGPGLSPTEMALLDSSIENVIAVCDQIRGAV